MLMHDFKRRTAYFHHERPYLFSQKTISQLIPLPPPHSRLITTVGVEGKRHCSGWGVLSLSNVLANIDRIARRAKFRDSTQSRWFILLSLHNANAPQQCITCLSCFQRVLAHPSTHSVQYECCVCIFARSFCFGPVVKIRVASKVKNENRHCTLKQSE